MHSLCVFCGSNSGARPEYAHAARDLGDLLARRGISLVYGGGRVGLMGTIADAALAAGGRVIGVIPDFLMAKELGHPGLTELHVVGSMHERKRLLCDLSDAFAALPGGMGTMDELCEILTWAQLGLHPHPVGLLNTRGYFDHLVALFDHMVGDGFLHQKHRRLLVTATDPAALVESIESHTPAHFDRWMDREQV